MDQPVVLANAPAMPAPAAAEQPRPFRFTGTAGEYFRIWIVNLLLTVATLGIYSAWAKVRRKQYFYRNTFVDDSSFEYLANPIPILKGRLIMAAALALLVGSQYVSVALYGLLAFLFALATPWIMVRALAFNARNSAYRNVRFSFQATNAEAYSTYFTAFAVYFFTFGLGFPYMQWRLSQFAVRGHRYGTLPFEFRTLAKDYIKPFFIALSMAFVVFLVIVAVLFAVAMLVGSGVQDVGDVGDAEVDRFMSFGIVAIFIIYAFMIVPAAYLKAEFANLFWGGMNIGPHMLTSNQKFGEVLALLVTNLIGVVLSLGLATPWAIIRSLRYRVEHLTLHPSGPLVVDADHDASTPGAFGDAATDLGDFDFDFG